MATITELLQQPPPQDFGLVPTQQPPPLTPPLPEVSIERDPFAGLEEVPDPFAGLEEVPDPEGDPFASLEPVDELQVRPVEDLVEDREFFDPIQYYSDNPDVVRNPEDRKKLLEVYRQRDKEGLVAKEVVKAAATEAVPTVGKIFTGLRDLAAGAIDVGLQPAANVVLGTLTGDIFDPQMRRELLAETKRGQKKGVAQQAAGSELAAFGLTDLARTGSRKLTESLQASGVGAAAVERAAQAVPTDSPERAAVEARAAELGVAVPEKTDQELLLQLAEGAEFRKQMQAIAQGEGEVAKATGLDKETLAEDGVTLNPEVIERLSLVDPLQIIAGAGVFRVANAAGNVLLTAPTRAAAEAAIGKIASHAATIAPRTAGKAAELTGRAVRAISPYVPLQGKKSLIDLAARGVEATGQGVVRTSDLLAGSSTFQKALLGTAEGALAAAPIAAAAEDDTTAGAILGAGALLGGAARGAIEGAGAPGRALVESRLAPKPDIFPRTTSRAYGISRGLDEAHAQAIKTLPEQARNEVNALREATRELGGEIYTLDPDLYFQTLMEHAERAKGANLNANEIAQLQGLARTKGYFDMTLPAADGKTRRVVVLNSAKPDVTHEVGHLFFSLLSPERQADLIQTARDTLTPEQRAEYQARYEQDLGRVESENYALEELVAENFSQALRNTRLRDLAAPPTLRQKIGRSLLDFAEEAGIDLTEGATTPAGAPSSYRFNNAVRRAANEVLNPPSAEPVVAPRAEPVSLGEAARQLEPLPRDIPAEVVSRAPRAAPRTRQPATPTEAAAQASNAAEAATLAAEAPTEPLAGGTRSPRELLGQVSEAIAAQEGIKINYLSAPDEPAAATTSNRAARREIIEAFRSMPQEARALWEKTFFPEKIRKTSKGYQVQGWAPEVFASNAHKLAKFLSETPEAAALSPYAIDPKTKSFTPDAWQQLYADTQTFVQNQARGATGSGEPLVVPRSATEAGAFAPPTRPGVRELGQTQADFINMLFGYKLPETPRIQKGKRPLNVIGQEVSEATMAGRVEPPVRPRGEFTGPEAVRQGIEGVSISEVNPLRNQFEAAAQAAKKPMPSFIESWQNLNLENIKEVQSVPEAPQFRGNTLTLTAGFQPERSWRVTGRRRGEKTEVTVRAEDIATARKLAEAEGLTVDRVEAGNKLDMDVGFQASGARTARGAEAEAAGFDVRHSGDPSRPRVGLFRDSELAGEIIATRNSPTEANIAEVRIEEPFRGQKLSEVLYREMGQRLKEEGIEDVTGMVVDERALSTRKKVFPDTTIESEIQIGDTAPAREVRSRIPLELQFQGPIRAAALRDVKTGKVYEDVTHFGALNKLIPDLEKGFNLETGLEGRIEDGFVTKDGDFVDRAAAAELVGREGELVSEDLR